MDAGLARSPRQPASQRQFGARMHAPASCARLPESVPLAAAAMSSVALPARSCSAPRCSDAGAAAADELPATAAAAVWLARVACSDSWAAAMISTRCPGRPGWFSEAPSKRLTMGGASPYTAGGTGKAGGHASVLNKQIGRASCMQAPAGPQRCRQAAGTSGCRELTAPRPVSHKQALDRALDPGLHLRHIHKPGCRARRQGEASAGGA